MTAAMTFEPSGITTRQALKHELMRALSRGDGSRAAEIRRQMANSDSQGKTGESQVALIENGEIVDVISLRAAGDFPESAN